MRVSFCFALVVCCSFFCFVNCEDDSSDDGYDAIIVPGGGLDPSSLEPWPWVIARLEKAMDLLSDNNSSSSAKPFLVLLSRSTPHKPPPLNDQGFPVDESSAMADYVVKRAKFPLERSRIITDAFSLDTIGNAYFSRFFVCQPLRLKRLLVITNSFHMPRTERIFDWIFNLEEEKESCPEETENTESGKEEKTCLSRSPFSLEFAAVENRGFSQEQLNGREQKEAHSLKLLDETIRRIRTIAQLARFVFTEHAAYAPGALQEANKVKHSDDVVSTY